MSEESDEVKELKMKLAKVEAEKSVLEDELLKVNWTFKDLQYENREKTRELEEVKERTLIGQKIHERTSADLRAVNKELGHRNAEKKKVVSANLRLMEAQGKMRKSLNTLKAQVSEEASLRMKDKQA